MGQAVTAINPRVLVWARERTGKRIEEVAEALGKPPEIIAAWESGEAAPTYPQLETLAYKIYRRPIALFFFPEPPDEPDPEHSFRTLPDFELEELSADTRFKIRQARSFQISLDELNGGVNPARSLIFRDINVRGRSSAQVAQDVRDYLGISLETQARDWRGPEDAFRGWRAAIEEKGVFVFKDAFKQDDVSGFCLYDVEFPVIYINNSAPATRQIFTLFHELAHILFATNGVTKLNDSYIRALTGESRRIEVFCNRFAADVLVPLRELHRVTAGRAPDEALIVELARHFKVSREVILRRFLDEGLVSRALYETRAREWTEEARSARTQAGDGGNYYATHAVYLGDTYLRLVFRRFYEGALSLEQLADHLNVRPKSVPGLEQRLLAKTAA
jgi:Zn-dependent peptidase ImmA (M78 family)